MDYQDLKPRITGVKIENLQQEIVELVSVWKNRTVLLSFLRHFG
ncbi:hypothetical protein HNR65_001843 [Desulfosalsimonas propionicica]|nr:hypothetical protein [Desulfosalsimonas propionicica]MBA2881516.1 hypothetical protein [Desulfosalsimonas propionicica]